MKSGLFGVFLAQLASAFLPACAVAEDIQPKMLTEMMGKPKPDTLTKLERFKLSCTPLETGNVVCRSDQLSVLFVENSTKSIDWNTRGSSADLRPEQFGDVTGCQITRSSRWSAYQNCPKLGADLTISIGDNGAVKSVSLLW